jgi:hypothetical protein
MLCKHVLRSVGVKPSTRSSASATANDGHLEVENLRASVRKQTIETKACKV